MWGASKIPLKLQLPFIRRIFSSQSLLNNTCWLTACPDRQIHNLCTRYSVQFCSGELSSDLSQTRNASALFWMGYCWAQWNVPPTTDGLWRLELRLCSFLFLCVVLYFEKQTSCQEISRFPLFLVEPWPWLSWQAEMCWSGGGWGHGACVYIALSPTQLVDLSLKLSRR